ncbi:DUF3566 domain-containing protein [Saccharothrix obliqua]|uniref:DUF3566 domain-containing protein n=1 Tax=Saccharothrix obliqua TaxID=2861747 RepID=UPI001C5FE8C4|nr:DUF3566 domain-containing protein [Saccharothrix obliqua]MBW4719484.1 DUF3566 domain-containing protein [Saccharothrix obliqua]
MSSPEKPEDKTAVITRPGAAEGTPEQQAVQTSSGSEQAAGEQEAPAAPPPWQRVANDAAQQGQAQQGQVPQPHYGEAQQVGPGDPAPEQPAEVGAQQPAYPASDPDTVAVARPVPPGGPQGGGRTSVNLGGSNGRPAGGSPSARRPGRGPRRASLQVKRVDPWSVLKLALVLSVALFFVWLVAVGVLYGVLNGMGVWDKINNTANDLLQGNESAGDPLISAGRVFGVAAIVGAVNIVLFTALATVGAFVYNVSADLAGGLEVTLSERE